MNEHLTRQKIIEIARSGKLLDNSHLNACAECRNQAELIARFNVIGRARLADAPGGWTDKAVALASVKSVDARVKELVARLTFDSWAVAAPVGVRGPAASGDRRLRFESDVVVFDLRAEQRREEWGLVAQVTGAPEAVSTISMEADRTLLLPDSNGLFQWTGKRPPKQIVLHAEDFQIELPELTWKRPRPK